MDYRVELDVYNGPMDLLLYLIKRDELDIYDIPIASITDSYLSYVNMLRDMHRKEGLDVNLAGDFLVMAATLMEVKSAMLLPRDTPAEGADGPSAAQELSDPRYELVQKLLEYKRFKDTASALASRQLSHQNRFARFPAKLEGQSDELPPLDMEEVQIWDLLDAFSKLMREVGARKPTEHQVIYDDTPIDLHAADIEDRLKREPHLSLRQLIEGRANKSEMIGVFLAILELIREKKILVQQEGILDDLNIVQAPPEHQKLHAEQLMNAAEETASPEIEPTPDLSGKVEGEVSVQDDLGHDADPNKPAGQI